MNNESRFPVEPWALTETDYRPEDAGRNASLFFLGNGYLGLRGGSAEQASGTCKTVGGTFINGFYESGPQVYGETAFGFPDKRQAMLNLPDPAGIEIRLDDERFSIGEGKLLEYKRSLRLDEGIVVCDLYWQSPAGRRMRLKTTRCVSMVRSHLALISCRISDLKDVYRLRIISSCDIEAVKPETDASDPRTGAGFEHSPLECLVRRAERDRAVVMQRTVNSGLSFAEAVSNSHCAGLRTQGIEEHDSGIDFHYEAQPGLSIQQEYLFDKFISYYSSVEEDEENLIPMAVGEVENAEKAGAELIIDEHRGCIKDFWESADITIEGDLQQGIRYNLFSIFQSAGRDGLRNIAAKGLSGEGYEGHYFWDTEIYVIPFFAYTQPEIASKLLEYRFSILDKARERARVMSEKGALFPWRTINGNEASAYFPAGTAQYHINADIAYGIKKYSAVSGDSEFMNSFGFEILIETARLWMSLGFFDDIDGSFRINCVTGPDEYTAIVNNNYFTNIMAKDNLEYAVESLMKIKKEYPDVYQQVADKTELTEEEPLGWIKAAGAMRLPYDERLCVHAQDDTFLQKERWDFTDSGLNRRPLLLNLHPLVIYRYQILKQPDVMLANFLQGDRFSRIQKMRDYDYYNQITTGDSSLSPCVQSIMAAELGRIDEAYDYFMKTARMDLDDINSNVSDGVHIAAMGGAWLSIIYGFAGLRDFDGELSFNPRLPDVWSRLKFRLKHRGLVLSVDYNHERAVYSLAGETGAHDSLKIVHKGSCYTVRSGSPVEISLEPELRAVIFDLDGVITDTSELHYQAWKRLADEEGFTFSREINEQLRGISRAASLDIILDASGVVLPRNIRKELAGRKNEYYKLLLKTITAENILPGIDSFISSLKERRIKTALASASRNAPEVIERLGMASAFDVIMDAAAVEKGKPDPEIFVSAAEKLGMLPEQCAAVEDAEAGVEAVKAGGIFAVGIGPAAAAADWPVSDTEALTLDGLVSRFGRGK